MIMIPKGSERFSPAEKVMLITYFCQAPKDLSMLAQMDVWVVFTGDGFRLVAHVLDRFNSLGGVTPIIFIIGPDNLVLAKGGAEIQARHLGQWLIDQGVPAQKIIADDDPASPYTHGQAKRLIHFAREYGWRKVVLFASGYHILRAWLTILGQMDQLGVGPLELLVVPEPVYRLSLTGQNLEIRDGRSALELFIMGTLPRIEEYQKKQPPDVATWPQAFQYLEMHQLIPDPGGLCW